jgi:hypothetical protein
VRTISDAAGRIWDAVLGKQSFGTLLVLFTPRQGGESRTSILQSESMLDAERELDGMSDDELLARLHDSVPWQ